MIKTKINSNSFEKKIIPWNKGMRVPLDLKKIVKLYYDDEKSTYDLGKIFNVSGRTIRNRLKENGYKLRNKQDITKRTKDKISKTNKIKGIQPKERYVGDPWNKGLSVDDERVRNNIKGLLENRKTQVLPVKDTSIEVKMQKLLTSLKIEFYTHKYMKEIEHGYQCDILIPVQGSIRKKTIIECYGDYWHNYPYGREIDSQRCNELRDKGWRVLVFWECEIKHMQLNNLQLIL